MKAHASMAIFRCPQCHAPQDVFPGGEAGGVCSQCGTTIEMAEGIPLLVRDRQRIAQVIEAARSDGRAAWYDQPQDVQLSGPYRHHIAKRITYVKGILVRHIKGLDRVPTALDLGCGDGNNLPWLAGLPLTLMASDYNLDRLLRARRRASGVRLFMADITDYPMLDDSLDIIFFNHVLEHIPDDMLALREVYRILRPGGLLILGVPNEGAAFWQMAYRLQPGVSASSDHLHHYTADTIAAKCIEAGFRLREVHPIGWGVPHWTLDALIRRFEWVDDGLEALGRRWLPSQATSLYLLLGK